MRTDLKRSKKSMEEEKDFRERRRELSGGERVKVKKKNGCLVTRIMEIGTANREKLVCLLVVV
jgi:hypothetical protein